MNQKFHFTGKAIFGAGFCMLLLLLTVGSVVARTDAIVEQYGLKTTWPQDAQWRVIGGVNDPDDLLSVQRLDFVGDAANPGGYYYSDGVYLYLRVRVGADTVNAGDYSDSIFVLIDNTGDLKPDYGFAWDSNQNITNHGLELSVPSTISTIWSDSRMADADNSSGQKIAPPDFAPQNTVRNDTSDGYIRTVDGQATTSFGGTTFVEFAVKWSFLEANTTLGKNQMWRIAYGSISNANDHNTLSYDISGGVSPSANVSAGWSLAVNSTPTAATLGNFTLKALEDRVRVRWQTLAEMNVVGFNVWRAARGNGGLKKLNAAIIPAKMVGQPNGTSYRFVDRQVKAGKRYTYKIEIVRADGSSEWSGPLRVRVP